MEEASARKLRFVTLQVVGAVAVVHLIVGAMELARLSEAGLLWTYFVGGRALSQPEPWLFVVSGVAILLGIAAVATGRLDYRRAYLLGIGMMAVYIVGWLAWHTVFDHGMVLEGGADVGGSHDHGDGHNHGGIFEVVVTHYVEPMIGVFTGANQPGQVTLSAVSKTLESIGLLLLVALVSFDPRAEASEPSETAKTAEQNGE